MSRQMLGLAWRGAVAGERRLLRGRRRAHHSDKSTRVCESVALLRPRKRRFSEDSGPRFLRRAPLKRGTSTNPIVGVGRGRGEVVVTAAGR